MIDSKQTPADTHSTQTNSRDSTRLVGIDVARSLAIGGMALVHFVMVLSATKMDDSTFAWLFDRLSGRPATVFMILAGIGVSLRFVNASNEVAIRTIRQGLFRRGCFFLVVGFANLLLWPGDILRVYGVAYLFAAYLAVAEKWVLLLSAVGVVGLFLAAVFSIDFATNWDFETLDYANLWTIKGGLLNLFYNGFRAVLPWLGVMFFGMWIGKFDLRSSQVRRVFFCCGVFSWIVAELLSFGLLKATIPLVTSTEAEELFAIFGTDSLPPLPLFLFSSGGLVVALIMLCVEMVERFPHNGWNWFANAGQMAFTWYISHIFVVVGAGIATDFRGDVSLQTTYVVSAVFYVMMCACSVFYRRHLSLGPLEWVMRKTVG